MARRDLQRRLAAIVFTDVVGFSRMMNRDESKALDVLETQRKLLAPIVGENGGAILKEMGDGLLIEFTSSVKAVQSAIEIQSAIRGHNAKDAPRFDVRIGIHMGDVVASGNDILGDGVNIASRVEPLANPGGICITQAVYDSIKSIVEINVKKTENVALKNIEEKHTVYEISLDIPPGMSEPDDESSQPLPRAKVETIENETDLKRALANLWPFYLFVLLVTLPSLFSGDWWWLSIMLLVLGGGAYFLHHRTVRLTFADIRHVGVLLDVLIVRMDYGLVERSGRQLTYVHAPAEWKNRPIFSWVKAADALSVSFDGNTVRMKGPNFHVQKVLNAIKKFSRQALGGQAL